MAPFWIDLETSMRTFFRSLWVTWTSSMAPPGPKLRRAGLSSQLACTPD